MTYVEPAIVSDLRTFVNWRLGGKLLTFQPFRIAENESLDAFLERFGPQAEQAVVDSLDELEAGENGAFIEGVKEHIMFISENLIVWFEELEENSELNSWIKAPATEEFPVLVMVHLFHRAVVLVVAVGVVERFKH